MAIATKAKPDRLLRQIETSESDCSSCWRIWRANNVHLDDEKGAAASRKTQSAAQPMGCAGRVTPGWLLMVLVPPLAFCDARCYWQDRKRAWSVLGMLKRIRLGDEGPLSLLSGTAGYPPACQ